MATFTLTSGNDTFIGSVYSSDQIFGAPGDFGSGDIISGGNSSGGHPADTFTFTSAGTLDLTSGGVFAYIEYIVGSSGNDTIKINHSTQLRGDGTVDLGGGTDLIEISSTNTPFTISPVLYNVEQISITGSVGGGNYTFSNSINNIIVSSLITSRVTINGGTGSDTIEGGLGGDVLNGGEGDDTFVVDSTSYQSGILESEQYNGGNGVDTMLVQTVDFTANTGFESEFSSIEALKFATAGRVTLNSLQLAGMGGNLTVSGSGGTNIMVLKTTTSGVIDISGFTFASGFNNAAWDPFFDRVELYGGSGSNVLTAAGGQNRLYGFEGTDTLTGGAGEDLLIGGTGGDTMIGGAGDDQYEVDDGGDSIVELDGGGTDTVTVYTTYYNMHDFVENLLTSNATNITGNGLDNTMTINLGGVSGVNIAGGGGNDSIAVSNNRGDMIAGNAGNDTLTGAGGADQFDGGEGDDTFTVNGTGDLLPDPSDALPESYSGGADTDTVLITDDTDFTAGIAAATFSSVEQLRMSTTALSITATLAAVAGLPTTVIGDFNTNALVLELQSAGSYSAAGFTFSVWTEGVDTVTVNGSSGDDTLTAATIGTILAGDAGNDVLNGGAGVDTLEGGAGNDTLTGNGGADNLEGGANNDIYYVGAGDTISELAGEGTDTVYASASLTLASNVEILRLQGTANIAATGNSGANSLFGNTGRNTLNGGADADRMYGGVGNDIYVVDNIGDRVVEQDGEGTDLVQSSITYSMALLPELENLTLTGTGAINATGNAERNIIVGNSGANTIDGKLGSDTLTGGLGVDRFTFSTALGATNIDRITDFVSRTDKIVLENAIMTKLGATGAFNAANFVIGTAAADAADRLVYDKVGGRLYYDADGNGAGAKVQILALTAGANLVAADILVI